MIAVDETLRELERRWRLQPESQAILNDLLAARRRASIPLDAELLGARRTAAAVVPAGVAGLNVHVEPPEDEAEDAVFLERLGFLGWSRDPFTYGSRRVGVTSADEPVEVPPARVWWVEPAKPGLDPAAAELIRDLRIPGLRVRALFGGDTAVRGLDRLESLRWLSLHEHRGGLEELARLPELAELDLASTWLSADRVRTLAGLPLVRLVGLHLSDGDEVAAIPAIPTLREVSLDIGTSLGHDEAVAALVEGNPTLRRLDFDSDSFFFDAGLEALCRLEHLEHLHLRKNHDVTADGVAGLAASGHLELLTLSDCRRATAGVGAFAGTGLRFLDLSHSLDLGDDIAAAVGAIPGLTHLGLNPYGAGDLTDVGVAALAKLSKLRALNLDGQYRVTAAGLAELTDLPITDLAIDRTCYVDDDAPRGEGDLRRHYAVRDEGLLDVLGRFGRLRRLHVKVGYQAAPIEAFQEALPGVEVRDAEDVRNGGSD